MAGVGGVPRARGLAIVVALLALGLPGRVDADDGGSIVLADDALTSMVADLDGDGDREVVAVRHHPDDPERLVVEAWRMAGGAWSSIGSAALERWDAEASGPQPARFGLEGHALLALRAGSHTRAIVATVTEDRDEFAGGCCLSISVLGIGEAGISVGLVGASLGTAESLQVADLDGDGTDELVVSRTVSFDSLDGSSVTEHRLLRQVRGGFEDEPIGLPDGDSFYVAMAGDTDGVPGDDLVFVGQDGSRLVRVVDEGGALRHEIATSLPEGLESVWPVGAANGLIAVADERRVTTLRWPRDGQPESVAVLSDRSFPSLIPLGAGPSARWVDLGGSGPTDLAMRVLGMDLQAERLIDVSPLTKNLWDLNNTGSGIPTDRSLWEQIGPIPGGLGPDRPAVLGHGSLVEVDGTGRLRVRPAAHLVGVGVMGIAGTGGEWLAVAGEWWGWGGNAYLGNMGYEPTHGMVGVIPMTAVLGPTSLQDLPVEVSGVTIAGSGPDRRLLTSGDAFQVLVAGEAGDLVVVNNDRRIQVEEIPETGSLALAVDPPGRDDRNREFDLSVFLVGRTGLTRGVSWQAEALRVAPEVTASAAGEILSLRATVSGQATPGVGLTVDGLPVTPSPSGRFRVEVDAPIWPRDVLVVARDAVGNETVERLEVVGFLDYRGLPFIPLVAALTAVVGGALFVRTPRVRRNPVALLEGDGRLEEIDGDPF